MRKINNLISDDHINNNHPVSTCGRCGPTIRPNTWQEKNCFVRLIALKLTTCCKWWTRNQSNFWHPSWPVGQSHTCDSHKTLQISLLLLELYEGISRKIIKADKFTQYFDDTGIATLTAEGLKINLCEVFHCVREAGLRLTTAKCQFIAKELEFLGRTVSPEGIALQTHKNDLQKLSFPKTKKGLPGIIGHVKNYRNYIPRLSAKVAPFHELVKENKPIEVTTEILDNFKNIDKSLDSACRLWLTQPLPNTRNVLMTDENFKNAGFAVMIEENAVEKLTSVKTTYAQ